MITVSVVSHGHAALVSPLLEDLMLCPEISRVILTRNVPEPDITVPHALRDRLLIMENKAPKGFGANHNAAFRQCETPFYCVLNPDIRLKGNPFPELLGRLNAGNIAVTAPAVLDPGGAIEDSVRHFPNIRGLLAKTLGIYDGRYQFEKNTEPFPADWVGGMFMLFSSADFSAINGFDERFFLYYEDVDICARLWNSGRKVVVCPQAAVVHDARRASHREWRHLRWHLASMARYFLKHWGRLPNTEVGQ